LLVSRHAISPEFQLKVLASPRAATRKNPAALTTRELEVLALVAEGLRNAEVADRLVVSRRTIDHHVSAILRKLDARTRGEAVATATRLGKAVFTQCKDDRGRVCGMSGVTPPPSGGGGGNACSTEQKNRCNCPGDMSCCPTDGSCFKDPSQVVFTMCKDNPSSACSMSGGSRSDKRSFAALKTSNVSSHPSVPQRRPRERSPRRPWTKGPPKSSVSSWSRRTVTSNAQRAEPASPARGQPTRVRRESARRR